MKLATVLGTVPPKRPISTSVVCSTPPMEIVKKTLSVTCNGKWREFDYMYSGTLECKDAYANYMSQLVHKLVNQKENNGKVR